MLYGGNRCEGLSTCVEVIFLPFKLLLDVTQLTLDHVLQVSPVALELLVVLVALVGLVGLPRLQKTHTSLEVQACSIVAGLVARRARASSARAAVSHELVGMLNQASASPPSSPTTTPSEGLEGLPPVPKENRPDLGQPQRQTLKRPCRRRHRLP